MEREFIFVLTQLLSWRQDSFLRHLFILAESLVSYRTENTPMIAGLGKVSPGELEEMG